MLKIRHEWILWLQQKLFICLNLKTYISYELGQGNTISHFSAYTIDTTKYKYIYKSLSVKGMIKEMV